MSLAQTICRFICEVLNPLFMLAHGIFVGVGYILTLLLPVSIDGWVALFWLSLLAPMVPLCVRFRRMRSNGSGASSWRMVLPLLPMLILLPGLMAKFGATNHLLANHGDVQGAYINQLMFGSTPIENVYMAGYPANHYWLFHAFVAPLARMTSLNPILVLTAYNIVAFFSGLLWLGQALVELKLAKPGTVFLGMAVLFAYCSVNIAGPLAVAGHLLDGLDLSKVSWIDAFRLLNLPGAQFRLHSVWAKVLGTGSMPIGLAAFCAGLWVCVRSLRGEGDRLTLALLTGATLVALATQPALALSLAIVVAAVLILAAHAQFKSAPADRTWIPWQSGALSVRWIMGWLAFSAILSVPLLHYLRLATAESEHFVALLRPSVGNLNMMLSASLLLLPLVALDVIYAVRYRDRFRACLLLSAGLLALVLAALHLADENQSKVVYALTILMAISALDALKLLGDRGAWRFLRLLLLAALFGLVGLQFVYVNHVLVLTQKHNYFFDGDKLSIADFNSPRAPAYYWIRRSAPLDAVVLMPLEVSYYDTLVTERLPFIKIAAPQYRYSNEAWEMRVDQQARFYSPETSADDYRALLSEMTAALPGRALYALVTDDQLSQSVMAEREAELSMAHGRGGFNVYRLNPE